MMRLIGLVVSLYVLIAVVVMGGAAYRFMFDDAPPIMDCAPEELAVRTNVGEEPLAGGPDWVSWALVRAAIWPKAYLDDQSKVSNPIDWLLVRYDPFGVACP